MSAPGAGALDIVEVHGDRDLDTLTVLAARIWNEYFPPIIGQAQVDYMVERFQSKAALADQLDSGYRYFLARRDGREIGYAGILIDREQRHTQLSKLYVARDARGLGAGRLLLEHVCALAREALSDRLWLTVNKYNEQALSFYARLGFVRTDELVMDIGNGFVMDDFRLDLALDSTPDSGHHRT